MSAERFQSLCETVRNCLPEELSGGSSTYAFLSPWLFVRRDLLRGVWRDRWYRDLFGFSRNRLFRDSWIRRAPSVDFPTSVECIRVKRVSVRYFDREANRVWKVLSSGNAREREKLAQHLVMVKKFSEVGATIPVLSSGEDFFVEPITNGIRVLEQDFLRKPDNASALVDIVIAIGSVEPLLDEDGLLSAGCHGDLMIHNLFWNPDEGGFIVIDWEAAGRGPVLWDSFLFFFVLLKKKAVRRSPGLLRKFDAVAAEHFGRVSKHYDLDRAQRLRQWEACVERFEGPLGIGAGERGSFGDARVDEDLGRLRKAVV